MSVLDGGPLPAAGGMRTGRENGLAIRRVPPTNPRPAWLANPRLRRASPISHFGVAAALEAVGGSDRRARRLGVVFCVMSGSVTYSRRFYEEVLRDPGTASPLMFPETVFNAPASHVSACLGSSAASYTLVGDAGMFIQGLALAAGWLDAGSMDAVLVVAAEEADWLSAEALRYFEASGVAAEGSGALLLNTKPSGALAELIGITTAHSFTGRIDRLEAARAVTAELDGFTQDKACPWFDAWCGHMPGVEPLPQRGVRVTEKLGDGLAAAGAWPCVAACEAISGSRSHTALVRVVGANQQAIGAVFAAPSLDAQSSAPCLRG